MWSTDDIAALWGWVQPSAPADVVPIDDRCWRCDTRRIHNGCAADLCGDCCEELRAAA